MSHLRASALGLLAGAVAGTPDERPIRWGIMGTGTIATDFVNVLKALPGTQVAAVGSRNVERASEFAEALALDGGTTTLHGSYEALAADDSLDVVYVATPSLRHVDDSLVCLRHGRAVLCEKSMAPSAREARRVLNEAAARQLFFAHAVWSRFFPVMARLRQTIQSGAIGRVTSAHVSFCQADGAGACSATLETGIYCVQFLLWVFDDAAPDVRAVVPDLHPGGLDQHVTAVLAFPCGGVGTFECSLIHSSPREAVICGTKGVIRVPFPFWCPTSFTVQTMDGPASQRFGPLTTIEEPLPDLGEAKPAGGFNFVHSEGLAYEALEVNRCIRAGLTEPPAFDAEACLRVMGVIEEVRSHWSHEGEVAGELAGSAQEPEFGVPPFRP